jgi:hypothetical protein
MSTDVPLAKQGTGGIRPAPDFPAMRMLFASVLLMATLTQFQWLADSIAGESRQAYLHRVTFYMRIRRDLN